MVVATYMDAIPRQASDHFSYAVVFDSDGDPADDWVPRDDFDLDFYQGTDRWYQIDLDPDRGQWAMTVSDGLAAYGPSAARAIVFGDTIVWIVPASEFDADLPAYRVPSFVHDGTLAPEASGGDVSGVDPTEPPLPVLDLDSPGAP